MPLFDVANCPLCIRLLVAMPLQFTYHGSSRSLYCYLSAKNEEGGSNRFLTSNSRPAKALTMTASWRPFRQRWLYHQWSRLRALFEYGINLDITTSTTDRYIYLYRDRHKNHHNRLRDRDMDCDRDNDMCQITNQCFNKVSWSQYDNFGGWGWVVTLT